MSPRMPDGSEFETFAIAGPDEGAAMLARIESLLFTSGLAAGDPALAAFDGVMLRLWAAIAPSERMAFAGRLAAMASVPPRILDRLARDEDVAIAGPLLERSPAVVEDTLVACARERGQLHLLALSRRCPLVATVTDVIVERGDTRVLVSTAANPGASFSDYGLTMLVGRAGESERLTVLVGSRGDLPDHLYDRLLSRATEEARRQIAHLARTLRAAGDSLDYGEARMAVERLARTGALDEDAVAGFARSRALSHAVAATAALADMTVQSVESALRQDRFEPVLLIGRALGWDWKTMKAVLDLRGRDDDLVSALAGWERLRPDTARAALRLRRDRIPV